MLLEQENIYDTKNKIKYTKKGFNDCYIINNYVNRN